MLTLRRLVTLLLPALVLSGCATLEGAVSPPPSRQEMCPRPTPAPAELKLPEAPNFRQRLLNFFSANPIAPTLSSPSSTEPRRP